MSRPILQANGLTKTFSRVGMGIFNSGRKVHAVSDVSFSINAGEAVGLVGESGCGKTTVGRMVSAIVVPTSGEVLLDGTPFVAPMSLARRAAVQSIFQDTLGGLNPRLDIARQMTEPLLIQGETSARAREDAACEALAEVGLSGDIMSCYPHNLSGGQRQRVLLARCLPLKPRLLVCDEAVSALDVSVQAHVVNLLSDLKERRGLASLFISHDLRVVGHLCERVGVMYLGRIVEIGDTKTVFGCPVHPYTIALTRSLPGARWARVRLKGEPPSPIDPPAGCSFHPRCDFATDVCRAEVPQQRALPDGRAVACHHAEETAA